ncbi:MAG: VWA domain-containing protein [Vicingaceae bacterium]
MKLLNFFLSIFFSFCLVFSSQAQTEAQKTRILFVLDGSQSMYARWENGQKMQIATRLLRELVDSLQGTKEVELALRAYGHQYSVTPGNRNCKDTKLEVAFAKNNHEKIKTKLQSIRPRGTTLIAYSLEQAANDFPPCKNCRNVIILITDGIEECDGDPCAVALALQKNGVALKPFVIGLGLEPEVMDAFKCVGNFYDATSEATFKTVLGIVISQALNNTTAQVNLLDELHKPTETNVPMTFYDAFSKQVRYNFVHTIDSRGNPDTIPIDPLGSYDLVVHTIPPVEKKNIKLTPGKHNIIAVDAPQGDLEIKMNGYNEYDDLKAIVRQPGNMKTLVIQDFDVKQRYLTGKYDLEILTLPRTYVKDVNIAQSRTTKVEIPQAGIVSIGTSGNGYGSIFLEDADELVWVCNLSTISSRESITLQPGRYRVVFRSINARQSIYTKEESFVIESGQSTQVKL